MTNKTINLFLFIVLVTTGLSSCKKCGHCEYTNGSQEPSYCNSEDPNIYKTYKANCEYNPNGRWIVD